jgi:hypothetical protein
VPIGAVGPIAASTSGFQLQRVIRRLRLASPPSFPNYTGGQHDDASDLHVLW